MSSLRFAPQAYRDIAAFLERLCTAVQGKKILDVSWHNRLVDRLPKIFDRILGPELQPAVIELTPYILDSFGNPTRVDFGTGHETAFMAFLMVLAAIGYFDDCGEGEEDVLGEEIGLRIFPRYIALMRRIQKQYMLEPAGSHGVWGLDDYHHIPFLLGACQLVGSEEKDVDGKALTPEKVIRN
ncbi:phosphotyrosyl phosphatase activator, putative, partial [Perkinsus marinus ATCC 50983]